MYRNIFENRKNPAELFENRKVHLKKLRRIENKIQNMY